MEEVKNETKQTKTKVFNVIILDKSGSMESIRQAAVDGFNETLAGIKKAQEKYAESQEHFVSLLTFCDCEKKYVFDKVPVAEARKLTLGDYEPCCCTPLYDAMGFTLTTMRNHVKKVDDAVVVVTIITDGYENASRKFSREQIRSMVTCHQERDNWDFLFLGADMDAISVAESYGIHPDRAVSTISDSQSVEMAYGAVIHANMYERSSSPSAPRTAAWKQDVEQDTKSRSRQ